MENVSKELKEKAISLGLCEEWTNEWQNEDKDALCEKYVKGIDFCIMHNYPSTQYMKDNFDGIMQNHGVFVDGKGSRNNLPKAVVNGLSIMDMSYDKFSVGTIYLRHNSALNIIAKDNAKVFIFTYDNCILNVKCSDNAIVYIYNHGGSINYDINENILVRYGSN